MARVPDVELERLKREVSIQRLVEGKGVALKKAGADYVGHCPFHEDRTPSLLVSPEKNLWHCLGACRAGGSVVDWVMKAEGVSFRHAVELLREEMPGAAPGPVVKVGTVRRLPMPLAPDAEDAVLLGQVVDYYHRQLKESPEALRYLASRGLESAEAIETFKLGFANRTLGLRLPMKNREAGAAVRGRLQRLGILRETGHEHFAGSLVVPVFDAEGRVTEMYGRKVTANLRPGTPLHLYLPGPHRGVWNAVAIGQQKGPVILCEALLDALTFWCAGHRHVTASYGVEGFTEAHLALFQERGIDEVLIAYDRDEAGDRAAEALAERLMKAGLTCRRVLFPRGMDANGYALKVTPREKALGLVLERAVFMGKGQRTHALGPGLSPLAAGVTGASETGTTEVAISTPEPTAVPEPLVSVTATRPEPTSEALPTPMANSTPESASTVVPTDLPATADRSEEVVLQLGDRRYRARGLEKATSYDSLRLNVLVARGERFFVDTLELYSARQRAAYEKEAAKELQLDEDVVHRDIGQLLLKLEALQDAALKAAATPKSPVPTMTESERAEALALLRSPDLLEQLLRDFEACGVVGESTNKLVGYLAAVSRKLEEPLAVLIQSSSAAGKSSLMDAVLAFVPPEDKVKYSAMTGQSLFYMGEADLAHKVLAVVEEEGASRAAYALKLLQSEGELTIASTGKDPASGRLVTHEYRVEGPTQLFLTTTAIELDEELLNRCLVLTVDEGPEQTRAIHEAQRRKQTLEGLLQRRTQQALVKKHQNAQRLLRPLLVANPFARHLTFLEDRTRTRRDNMKYLTLIRTLAFLHQHQRPARRVHHQGQDVDYVEASLGDVEVANRLAHQVLGRSLDDVPPQTRGLLHRLEAMVDGLAEAKGVRRSDVRFTRRQVREATGLGHTQLKIHLGRLEELEYVAVHRGAAGFLYQLTYDGGGKDGQPFLSGLLDVETLKQQYDSSRSAPETGWSAPGRPEVGGVSGPGRPGAVAETDKGNEAIEETELPRARSARSRLPARPSNAVTSALATGT